MVLSMAVVTAMVIFAHVATFPMFMYGIMLLSHGNNGKKKIGNEHPEGTEATKEAAAETESVKAVNGAAAKTSVGVHKKQKPLWHQQEQPASLETNDIPALPSNKDGAVEIYSPEEGVWFGEEQDGTYPWRGQAKSNGSSARNSQHSDVSVTASDSDVREERHRMLVDRRGKETEHIRLMCELVGSDELGPEVTFAARQVVLEFLSREIDERVIEFDSDDED